MSGTFKGFSDYDIENIKSGHDLSKLTEFGGYHQPVYKNKTNLEGKRIFRKMNPTASMNASVLPIPEDAKLSKTVLKTSDCVRTESDCDDIGDRNNTFNGGDNIVVLDSNQTEEFSNNNNCENSCLENSTMQLLNHPESCNKQKPINLEEFQATQKLMEEQNRQRKELIAKALADRTKQTVEEAIRLENIKKELLTLDSKLSVDVCILRKQIDQASLSFADAEKHYNKVESEFLAAKINLHKEREKKEQLTEHLCAIIAHNEARKAKKLEDLMEQLKHNKTCNIVDGVCEQTGKMLELDENGEVINNNDNED